MHCISDSNIYPTTNSWWPWNGFNFLWFYIALQSCGFYWFFKNVSLQKLAERTPSKHFMAPILRTVQRNSRPVPGHTPMTQKFKVPMPMANFRKRALSTNTSNLRTGDLYNLQPTTSMKNLHPTISMQNLSVRGKESLAFSDMSSFSLNVSSSTAIDQPMNQPM